MPPTKWLDGYDQRLTELNNSGATYEQAANELGVSIALIGRKVRKLGLTWNRKQPGNARTAKGGSAGKDKVALAMRKVGALDLRLMGWTYRQIAEEANTTDETVRAWIEGEIKNLPKDSAQLVLDLELDRLDQLQTAAWNLAIQGDTDSIKTILEIMDRRAKYLGLHGMRDDQRLEALSVADRIIIQVGVQPHDDDD